MPLYEYRCRRCGARVEALQKVADPPLVTCSACGGPLERLVSAPALQFKGAGWYVTDYARKGAKDTGSDQGATAGGDGQPAAATTKAGTDAKPAAGGAAKDKG